MSTLSAIRPLRTRELYAPSHFGNAYEATLPNEMTARLAEAKFWGFNRFTDWFNTVDLCDVYRKRDGLFNMPETVWARKFANYKCAADLGFALGLVVTPNHVFLDQVTEKTAAPTGGHVFGQLVCPSKPGVTDMILGNYHRLFQDFADRGLHLASISGGAYDYGGCACDACRPWAVTFGRLFKQIGELADDFFGGISVELWGWWWSDDDHRDFSGWADASACVSWRSGCAKGAQCSILLRTPSTRSCVTPDVLQGERSPCVRASN